jgi:hypothetical protein
MADPLGEITLRAGRANRTAPYAFMGVVLTACAALGTSSLFTAHTIAARDNLSTAAFVTAVISTTVGAMAATIWLTLFLGGASLGSTTFNEDGLLLIKPCRRPRYVLWTEIDAVTVDTLSYFTRGIPSMGLRVSVGTTGYFLPGVIRSGPDPVFQEQVDEVKAAWKRAIPDSARPDPNRNRSRSRRLRNRKT